MCWAAPVAAPADWPCAVALPSIGRSDAAFAEQVYWRGRAWAPQAFIVYLGLQRYSDVPEAAAARRTLAAMAPRVFLRALDLFGQVNENVDGLLGIGSDSSRADSYYHWGALNAFVGLIEAGAYPAGVLVAPAPAE
jgi:putative isomerase